MIQGIKIQISTEELKITLLEKVTYHTEKSKFYAEKVTSLKESDAQSDLSLYNASNNPVDSLAGSSKKHQGKADYFKFIVDHLVPNETYELTEQDLIQLEMVSRYY